MLKIKHLIIFVCMGQISCLPGVGFFKQEKTENEFTLVPVNLVGETTIGRVKSDTSLTQRVQVPADGELAGSYIDLPSASIPKNMTVMIEEVQSTASDFVLAGLGVQSADIDSIATAFANDSGLLVMDRGLASTVRIRSSLANSESKAFTDGAIKVMYARYIKEDGQCYDSLFQLSEAHFQSESDGEYITFRTPYFGSYQIIGLEKYEFSSDPKTTQWEENLLNERQYEGPCPFLSKAQKLVLDETKPINLDDISTNFDQQGLVFTAQALSEDPWHCSIRLSNSTGNILYQGGSGSTVSMNLGSSGFPLNMIGRYQCTFEDGRILDWTSLNLPVGIQVTLDRGDRIVTIETDQNSEDACSLEAYHADNREDTFVEAVADPTRHQLSYGGKNIDVDYYIRMVCLSSIGIRKESPYLRVDLGGIPEDNILNGSISWINEASDGYIIAGEENSPNAAIELRGYYSTALFTIFLEDTADLVCDDEQDYSLANIPTIESLKTDGIFSICAMLQDRFGNLIYLKSPSPLTRDVKVPNFLSPMILSESLGDSQLSASEYSSASELIVMDATLDEGELVGYRIARSGDDCSSLESYKRPLLSNDENLEEDGNYKICVKATDLVGNVSYDETGPSQYILLDKTVPSLSQVVLVGDASDLFINAIENRNGSSVISHNGDGGGVVQFEIVSTFHLCSSTPSQAWTSTAPVSSSVTSEGRYKICVRISDGINPDAIGESQVFTLDTSAPDIDAGIDIVVNQPIALNPSLGDAVRWTWSGPSELGFSNPNVSRTTVESSSDGVYSVTLTAFDDAGNSSSDSLELTWDTTGPSVDAGSDIIIGSVINSNGSVGSDAVSFRWSQVSGEGRVLFSEPNSLNTTISADLDTTYRIRLSVEDSLGNRSFDDLDFTWDTTAVTVNIGEDIYVKNSGEAAVEATVANEGARPQYTWSKVSGPGELSFLPSSSQKDLTGIEASEDGSYVIRLRVFNTINSNEGSDDITLHWDTVAPVITGVSPAGDIADDPYLNEEERSSENSLVENLVASGHDLIEYTIADQSVECSQAEDYREDPPKSNDSRIVSDGSYKVCIRLRDYASNTPALDGSIIFTVDTLAPEFSSILIDDGALYDRDGLVNLKLESQGASELKISNDSTCSSGVFEPYVTRKDDWELSDRNQLAGVFAIFRDRAGNLGPCVSDDVIHDDRPPSNPRIRIDNDNEYTNTQNVTLSLSADEATSIYISNESDCEDGGIDEPFRSSKDWVLNQANTQVSVFAKFRDAAGNWSPCVSDSIVHDDTAPLISLISQDWINVSNVSAYEISGECDEEGASVLIGGSLSTSTICENGSYSAFINYSSMNDGYSNIEVFSEIEDQAGNKGVSSTVRLNKDITPPEVTLTNSGWINEDTQSRYQVRGTCTDTTSGSNGSVVNIGGFLSASTTCIGGAFTLEVNYSSQTDGVLNTVITAQVDDLAGNGSRQALTRVSKDSVDPIISLRDTGNINLANRSSYVISGLCSDLLSGVEGQIVAIGGDYSNTSLCSSDQFSGEYNLSELTEGNFTLIGTIVDIAGNQASSAPFTKKKDSVIPTSPSNVGLSEPEKGTARVSFSSGFDIHLASHNVKVCQASNCLTACTGPFSTSDSPIDISDLGSGYYWGCVQAEDSFSNQSDFVSSRESILIDESPPIPGQPNSISTRDTYYYTSTLNWILGTDDLASESQLRYSVFYSKSPNFDTVEEVEAGIAVETLRNNLSSLTIKGLEPDTVYYFNVVIYDLVGNASVYRKQRIKTLSLKRISAGRGRTCLLNHMGKVYCTGEGEGGFGDNSENDYNMPSLVDSGISAMNFVSIDSGLRGACGLTDDSKIYCWGEGSQGQLGNSSSSDSSSPVLVSGGRSWRFITTGEYSTSQAFACGITTEGDGYCWGNGGQGRLGNGDTSQFDTPQLVVGGHKWRMISAGSRHACGVTEDGSGYCWGSGDNRRLGVADTGDQDIPTLVQGGYSWQEIHAGTNSSCGITNDRVTYCWGGDDYGQLGNGELNETQEIPVKVEGDHVFRHLELGGGYSVCGVSVENELFCWGRGEKYALGNGDVSNISIPTLIMSNIYSADLGYNYGCALKNSGAAFCWGEGLNGQTGLGYNYPVSKFPSMVLSPETWLNGMISDPQIVEGNGSNRLSWILPPGSAGVLILSHESDINVSPKNGVGYSIGDQVGSARVVYVGTGSTFTDTNLINDSNVHYTLYSFDGYFSYSSATWLMGTPSESPDYHQKIAIGLYGGCAINSTGTPYCWGDNSLDFLGNGMENGSLSPSPVNISGITGRFLHLTVSRSWACGLTSNQEAWCWGYNNNGQLGQGDNLQRPTPVKVPGSWRTLMATIDDYADVNFICGIQIDGALYCWGENGDGQLGQGNKVDSQTPLQVKGNMKWKSVFAGLLETCATTMTGEGLCWGRGGKENSSDLLYSPLSIDGGSRIWRGVYIGSRSACGIQYDGKSFCWGDNLDGELGLGDRSARELPTELAGYTFRSFRAGKDHRCAITTSDDLYCWGQNDEGQLGDGSKTTRLSPVLIRSGVDEIAAGSENSCLIDRSGDYFCWGSTDRFGHIGSGSVIYPDTDASTPTILDWTP